MVAMFVREKDAVELVGGEAQLGETRDGLTRAQTGIDEQPAIPGGQQGAVARAAAAEDREGEHACVSINPKRPARANGNAPAERSGPPRPSYSVPNGHRRKEPGLQSGKAGGKRNPVREHVAHHVRTPRRTRKRIAHGAHIQLTREADILRLRANARPR